MADTTGRHSERPAAPPGGAGGLPADPTGAAPYRRVAGRLDPSMIVVTAAADSDRDGCLVGFHTQCSIDPPRHAVCLSPANRTWRLADRAEVLAVHFLEADQLALAELFGSVTGDETDKLSVCAWQPGHGGVPVLADARHWFVGAVVDRLPCGDHELFVLEPLGGASAEVLLPLGYETVRHVEPGHAP